MNSTTRRNAIKTLVTGSGLLLFSPNSLLAVTGKKKERLGVALVGLGYYSTDLLAPALQQTQHCYLAGIVTGTPAKASAWQKKYNIPDKNIYDYGNFDQIANNPDIDVVYVVLPPSMHKEYTIRAANAGKHVWCEKPMAMTAQECQEMITACRSNKKQLAIGYRLQHEPTTRAWRKLISDKALGKVQSVNCAAGYRDNRTDHWKQKKEMGGGVMYDMGVYSIQGARLGTGSEPIRVLSAQTSTTRPEIYKNGLDETAVAKLEFPGGIIADIKTSFGENINFLDIRCEKGIINVSPYSAYNGQLVTSPLGKIQHPYSIPMQQTIQMDADALALLNNKPMAVPGEEGMRDIRIVESIYRSAASSAPVKL
jgi:glucose-fructose oxidoreductase